MTSTFVWADLSTFDFEEAKSFYTKCFGWKFQGIGENYQICQAAGESAAGIYPMPEKFQNIGMPSFWMSYIHVSDIKQIVHSAEKYGAKVEIQPQKGLGGGLIALIRDPAGAGFTCYQGENPGGKHGAGAHGRMVWNELHVSNLAKVEAFYTNVFGWSISPSSENKLYDVHNSAGELIAGIRVYENEIKGDKEYWGVYFSVTDLKATIDVIEKTGGNVVVEETIEDGSSVLAYDSQGAAFFLLDQKSAQSGNTDKPQSTVKWRAISGLCIVLASVIFNAIQLIF